MFKGAIYLKEYAILDLLEMKVVKGDPSVVSPSTLLSLLIMATGLKFDRKSSVNVAVIYSAHKQFVVRSPLKRDVHWKTN